MQWIAWGACAHGPLLRSVDSSFTYASLFQMMQPSLIRILCWEEKSTDKGQGQLTQWTITMRTCVVLHLSLVTSVTIATTATSAGTLDEGWLRYSESKVRKGVAHGCCRFNSSTRPGSPANGLDHSLPVPVASLFPRRLELEEGTEKVIARNSIK